VSTQYQTAALKTTQKIQKQQGEVAVALILSAVEATDHSIPSRSSNNVGVTAQLTTLSYTKLTFACRLRFIWKHL
jgi:hypothetical protein